MSGKPGIWRQHTLGKDGSSQNSGIVPVCVIKTHAVLAWFFSAVSAIASCVGVCPVVQVGMICSNEPGYYEDGGFGIRVENLLTIEEAGTEFRWEGGA